MRRTEVENVMTNKKLNEKELLAKNPKAAKILQENRKKLAGKPRPRQREYGLGLPYARPALVSSTDEEERNELYA
jgi:hypothetical protein